MHRLLAMAAALAACAPPPSPTPVRARDVQDAAPPRSAETPKPSPSVAPDAGAPSPPKREIRTSPHPRIATRCTKPLKNLCPEGRCPTYDEARTHALLAARDEGPESCTGLGSGDVAIGTCGAFRFVEDGDCLSGITRFFDASGKLVSAYAWTDVKQPCGMGTLYGTPPPCEGAADAGADPTDDASPVTESPYCRNRFEPPSPHSTGECSSDADCRARPHGRCARVTLPRRLENRCLYEECASDADCKRGRCACDAKGVRRCLPGACRSDAHCPTGQRCQYENAYKGKHYLGQPYCTTPRDQCTPLNDSQCGASGACTYSIAARRWQCDPGAMRGLTD